MARHPLPLPTEAEDAALLTAATSDPDNPPTSNTDWDRARPFGISHPELAEALRRRGLSNK